MQTQIWTVQFTLVMASHRCKDRKRENNWVGVKFIENDAKIIDKGEVIFESRTVP